eukprot:CAMPEP_0115846204 /NCGR_PEP_ID=MMETSP0287-20121206/9742_1 /TAXON_ID=412157 /ORGANISM="Chrysochromulina rotalis, Strain UIO044" /LENGTH=257 /DNA_ID=CAMNT_0003299991 /DNA_START=244 /DNA_END=1018 /DNA_ORIENTATION=+
MVAPPNNISCHSGAHAACTRPRPSPLGTSTHSRAARAPAPAVERGGRRGVWGAPLGARRRLGGQDEADDQAVQAESLREDQDEDHADVELRLLGRRAHASVAHNADRNACSHAAEAAREASCEVRVAGERRVLRDATGRRRNAVGDDDGNDEAVDADTPAMTTGMIDFITRSGFITPIDETPTPDLAVPYAAPRLAKMSATAAPMKPKNGALAGHNSDDIDVSEKAAMSEARRMGKGKVNGGKSFGSTEGKKQWLGF